MSSSNIYNILKKLNALEPKAAETQTQVTKPIYESVEARGSIMSGVNRLEKKLSEQFAADKKALDTNPKNAAWDADAIAKKKALIAREKQKMGMQRKISGQDTGLPPAMDEGHDHDDEEDDVCPECDGEGCPECYGDEHRDRAHAHAQGTQRESADGAATVKYGVFSKGGSVGSQRFKDDPLKTFDSKEEAIADAKRRRAGLSKGERGYYRMGYVVKAIKDVTEAAGTMPVNKYIAQELDTLLKLAQDHVDDIVNRSHGGYGNKKSSGLEDAIFELSGVSNGFHSSMEEGVAELQELNSELPRIGNWIIRNLKKVGNRIDLPQLIKQETSEKSGIAEGWGDMEADVKRRDAERRSGKKATATGVKHHGKYGTEYQGDADEEEAAAKAADKGPKKRGRPAKGLAKPKPAAGEKKGRGRPKKAADPTYSGAKDLQSYIVGNLPKKSKIKGKVHKIDELSPHTLGSYVKKASKDLVPLTRMNKELDTWKKDDDSYEKYAHKDPKKRQPRRVAPFPPLAKKYLDKSTLQTKNRTGGISKAVDRLLTKESQMFESRMIDEAGQHLEHILNRFKHEVRKFEETGELDNDSGLYDALYDYYCDSGEMPYGVAKAREGDPVAWVADRLDQYLGTSDSMNMPMRSIEDESIELEDIAPVAGQPLPGLGQGASHIDATQAAQFKPGTNVLIGGRMPAVVKSISGTTATVYDPLNPDSPFNIDTSKLQSAPAPAAAPVAAMETELNELAKLAGLTVETKAKPDYIDLDKDGNKKEPMSQAAQDAEDDDHDYANRLDDEQLDEGECGKCNCAPCECNEGNAFGAAVAKAKADGVQRGEKVQVGGKSYAVREAEEMILMMRNAGLDTSRAEMALAEAYKYGDTDVEEAPEYANSPDEKIENVDAILRQGNDLNREKKQFAGKPKAGDNPMASEGMDPLAAMGRRLMRAYESIKVVDEGMVDKVKGMFGKAKQGSGNGTGNLFNEPAVKADTKSYLKKSAKQPNGPGNVKNIFDKK